MLGRDIFWGVELEYMQLAFEKYLLKFNIYVKITDCNGSPALFNSLF